MNNPPSRILRRGRHRRVRGLHGESSTGLTLVTRVGGRSEPDLQLRAANEFQIANNLRR